MAAELVFRRGLPALEWVPVRAAAGARPRADLVVLLETLHDGNAIPRELVAPATLGRPADRAELARLQAMERDHGADLVARALAHELGTGGFGRVAIARLLLDVGRFSGVARPGDDHLARRAIGAHVAPLLSPEQGEALLAAHYDPVWAAQVAAVERANGGLWVSPGRSGCAAVPDGWTGATGAAPGGRSAAMAGGPTVLRLAVHTFDRRGPDGRLRPELSLLTRAQVPGQTRGQTPGQAPDRTYGHEHGDERRQERGPSLPEEEVSGKAGPRGFAVRGAAGPPVPPVPGEMAQPPQPLAPGVFDAVVPMTVGQDTAGTTLAALLADVLVADGFEVTQNDPYELPLGSVEIRLLVRRYLGRLRRLFEAVALPRSVDAAARWVWPTLEDVTLRRGASADFMTCVGGPAARAAVLPAAARAAYREIVAVARTRATELTEPASRPRFATLVLEVRKDLVASDWADILADDRANVDLSDLGVARRRLAARALARRRARAIATSVAAALRRYAG